MVLMTFSGRLLAIDGSEIVAIVERPDRRCEVFVRGEGDPFVVDGPFVDLRKSVETAKKLNASGK